MAAERQGNVAARFPIFLSQIPMAVDCSDALKTIDFVNNQQLILEPSYLFAPGTTKESIAPQMEYMGAPKHE